MTSYSASVPRFEFRHRGRTVRGMVQGAGGFVKDEARLRRAKRQAALGRDSGLYEPKPGYVAVYPHFSAHSNGPMRIVPLSAYVGPVHVSSRDHRRRSRDPKESPVPKAMRIIRRYHDEGLTWEAAARRFKRDHYHMAFDVMDRVGSYPSSDPELRALQKVW
jgi:hypothetical protein